MYASVLKMDRKVLFIPVVFLLVRIWGTTRYFLSLMPSCSSHCPDLDEQYNCNCDNILYHPVLVYLQVYTVVTSHVVFIVASSEYHAREIFGRGNFGEPYR